MPSQIMLILISSMLLTKYDPTLGLYVAIYPESLYKILGSAEFATTFVKFGNATLYSNGNVTQENNNLGEGELFAVGSNYRIEDVLKYSVEHYGVISLIWTFIIFVSAKSLVHHMYQFNLNYWRVRRAIKLKQFHPYIQPVVNKSGEVTGGEVLVREAAIKWSAAPDMTPQTVLYRRPVAQFSNFQPKIVSSWLILALFQANFLISGRSRLCPYQLVNSNQVRQGE
ncbi:EAL domain-containing protein [Shewanella fodinae]|uniref:EAL domain-containing protein n=1 Tax=Shewanella fodinae TaxID=552357 RepID=A0A4V2RRG2_9GAMM|nr:EAL domain-containing protein [Shewanella fodinae]TCN75707.1 EAL domain-containing protein [Shewanella fodinae]